MKYVSLNTWLDFLIRKILYYIWHRKAIKLIIKFFSFINNFLTFFPGFFPVFIEVFAIFFGGLIC